jgi:hypothetical protein
MKRYRDALYIGQVADNEKKQRQGTGLMLYSNGRLYEGDWREDKREGRGYERYQNGSIYTGQFK